MRKRALILVGSLAIIAGCQYDEPTVEKFVDGFEVSLESIVSESEVETKTFADDQHMVLWHNDDRVSVFEKKEYWEEYKYTGRTGTTGGRLIPLASAGSGTGGDLDYYYAVYPHSESNGFDNKGHLLLTLPNEQPYDEFSFGRGTNLMVSASEDNNFKFKNIGGYLVFRLYGEGVSVSSIRLTGNNGEEISGDIDVVISPEVDPVVTMSTARYAEKYDYIELVCDPPVSLGATSSDYKEFWFVLPPMTFSGGFSIEVMTAYGGVWTKTTVKSWTITRNHYTPVSAMEVAVEHPQSNNVIYYTSTDGQIVTPNATDVFGANIISNKYVDGLGVISFDGDVVSIGESAFSGCTNLASINLGTSLVSIGSYAFYGCSSLSAIDIPDSVLSIGEKALSECKTISIGANVSSISTTAFSPANIDKLVVSEKNETYDSRDNCNSLIETASNTLICGGRNSIIPEGIEIIGEEAFLESGMETIVIPSSVVLIKERAFSLYNVFKTVYCYASTPPTLEFMTFPNYWHPFYTSFMWSYETTIFVPSNSYQDYISEWGDLNSITIEKMEIIPEAVDLGLTSGIKWASFNIGASTPEEYGNYYSWGETETKNQYTWSTYKWCNGSYDSLTKYNTKNKYGTVDSKTELSDYNYVDDIARKALGGTWRLPTETEWTELRTECTWTMATQNGVNGRKVTGKNGNSIFLPSAGDKYDTELIDVGSRSFYWSSSLAVDSIFASGVGFDSSSIYKGQSARCRGGSVRPVSE